MSNSGCRWGRSRWPTSPASTSAGTATRTGSRISATLCARSTAGARRRAPASTIMTRSAGRRPSPVVQQIIEDFASKQGVERREISDEEIVERTLYTMVNEGAKILEEGIAQRASDIDVVWVYGYGWPVYRGGPMFWADTVGLRQDRRGPETPGRADEARVQLLASCCSTRPKRASVSPAERGNHRYGGASNGCIAAGERHGNCPEAVPQDPLRRYSNAAVAFHWVTVALVLTQVVARLCVRRIHGQGAGRGPKCSRGTRRSAR